MTQPIAQASVFRAATRAAGHDVSMWWLTELAQATLFIDQALPSAGTTGGCR